MTKSTKKKVAFLSKEFLIFHFRIMFASGSALFFIAWIIQNTRENEAKGETEQLLLKQSKVNHLFDARRIWLESMYTHQAIKNDSVAVDKMYFVKAFNYLETTVNTLDAINEILLDSVEYKNENNRYAKILEVSKMSFEMKNYGRVTQIADSLNSNIQDQFTKGGIKTQEKLKELNEKEKSANTFYIILYIIGTLLISADYIFLKRRKFRELNGIATLQ